MSKRDRYYPWAAADIVPASLQVIGIGLTVEQHPVHLLWAQVEASGGSRIPLPTPAGSLDECRVEEALFRAATLRSLLRHWPAESGAAPQEFVENYPVPAMFAWPSRYTNAVELQVLVNHYFNTMQRALRNGAGMPFHDISRSCSGFRLETDNDLMWVEAFERFDSAGDLNSLLLWAEDGYAVRSMTGGWRNAQNESLHTILARPKGVIDVSESFAGLLLARSGAAEWLRELAKHAYDSSQIKKLGNGHQSRTAYGVASLNRQYRTGSRVYPSPSSHDKKTAHVPSAWSEAQVAQYDGMPTLAWVHRPYQASYGADDSMPGAQRVAQLQTTLQAVLDGPMQGQVPTRIMYDTGPGEGGMQRMLQLRQAIAAVLPTFDLLDVKTGYDLSRCLGETGAASAFAGVGLASLAAWETGGSALVVNARREDGVTVLAVKAPNDAYRARFQKRPYEAN